MSEQRWFKQHRLEWIAEMLRIYGFINRQHIMRKFGLSMPQASIDLRDFQKLYPKVAEYDLSAKAFVPRRPRPFDSPVDDIFDAFEAKQKKGKAKK
jgi:hypothetical protein